jgi:hypothetical protein
MTARPIDPESRRNPVYAAVVLVLVMVAVLLAAGCMSQQPADAPASTTAIATKIPTPVNSSPVTTTPVVIRNSSPAVTMNEKIATAQDNSPLFEIVGSTTVIIQRGTSVSDLSSHGYLGPEIKRMAPFIKKFDLVTFNHTTINEKLKSEQKLTVRIRGKECAANLTRMTFENYDDGIDSYHGSVDCENWSDMLVTISPSVFIGRLDLGGERIDFQRAENRYGTENSVTPLHFIYSTKDTEDLRFVIDTGTATVPSTTKP